MSGVKKNIAYLALCALGIAFFLTGSLYCHLGKPAIWFDEGIYLHAAHVLDEHGVYGLQLAPATFSDLSLISVGYPLLYPLSKVIQVYGPSLSAARGMMIAAIGLLVLFAFLLAKKLYGKLAAVFTLLLMTSFYPLYGNGKTVIGEVPGLAFLTAALFFFHQARYAQRLHALYASISGVLFGLALATKPLFILLLPALVAALVFHRTYWKKNWHLVVTGLMWCALPCLWWVLTQFGGEISFTRIAQHYANPYALPDLYELVIANAARFVTETTPLHFFFLLFVTAVFALGNRRARRAPEAELFVLGFALLIALLYLRTPGWYRYLFPGHLLLFIPFSGACAYWYQQLRNTKKIFAAGLLALPIALTLVQAAQAYREERLCDTDRTAQARYALTQVSPTSSVLFYNTPELAFSYPHASFDQFFKITDAITLGNESVARLNKNAYDVLVLPSAGTSTIAALYTTQCYTATLDAGQYTILSKVPDSCVPEETP